MRISLGSITKHLPPAYADAFVCILRDVARVAYDRGREDATRAYDRGREDARDQFEQELLEALQSAIARTGALGL